jgi:hypothetical protein
MQEHLNNNKKQTLGGSCQAHLRGYSGLLGLFGPAALGQTLAANGNLNRIGIKPTRKAHNKPKQPKHKQNQEQYKNTRKQIVTLAAAETANRSRMLHLRSMRWPAEFLGGFVVPLMGRRIIALAYSHT